MSNIYRRLDEVDIAMMLESNRSLNEAAETAMGGEPVMSDEELDAAIEEMENECKEMLDVEKVLDDEEVLNSLDPVDMDNTEEAQSSADLSLIGDNDGELIDIAMRGEF